MTGSITVDSQHFFKRQYYEQLHANKYNNLYVMDKFFEGHKLPKLTQKET